MAANMAAEKPGIAVASLISVQKTAQFVLN
jgi:hypothetical protein